MRPTLRDLLIAAGLMVVAYGLVYFACILATAAAR